MRREYQLEKQFVGKVLIAIGIICFVLTIAIQGHFIISAYKGVEYPSVNQTVGMWEDMYSPIPHYPPNQPADYGYMNKYKFENSTEYAWLRIYHYVWVGGGHIVDDEPVRIWYDENNKPVKVGYNIHYNQVEHYDFSTTYDNKYGTYRVNIWFSPDAHTPSITSVSYGWESWWRVAPLCIGIMLGIFFISIGYLYSTEGVKETVGGRM